MRNEGILFEFIKLLNIIGFKKDIRYDNYDYEKYTFHYKQYNYDIYTHNYIDIIKIDTEKMNSNADCNVDDYTYVKAMEFLNNKFRTIIRKNKIFKLLNNG